jgi:hypothetical protein
VVATWKWQWKWTLWRRDRRVHFHLDSKQPHANAVEGEEEEKKIWKQSRT